MGHVTMENRHGLAVAGVVTKATGTAERRASKRCWRPSARPSVTASRQARTRPMIRRTMWRSCVPSTSRRMWRRTMAGPNRQAAEARSMPARQGTRAMACLVRQFDWIEVGRVFRQVAQRRVRFLNRLANWWAPCGRGSYPSQRCRCAGERGNEALLDIGEEQSLQSWHLRPPIGRSFCCGARQQRR